MGAKEKSSLLEILVKDSHIVHWCYTPLSHHCKWIFDFNTVNIQLAHIWYIFWRVLQWYQQIHYSYPAISGSISLSGTLLHAAKVRMYWVLHPLWHQDVKSNRPTQPSSQLQFVPIISKWIPILRCHLPQCKPLEKAIIGNKLAVGSAEKREWPPPHSPVNPSTPTRPLPRKD